MSFHGSDRNALYLTSFLQRNTRALFTKKIAQHDVTIHMFSVLFEIHAGPNQVTSSELARRSYVSPQSVNVVVQRLEDRGYVSREPVGRGRRLALALTDSGRELLAELNRAQREVIDEMMQHAPISETEFCQTLVQLIESFQRSQHERQSM